MGNDETRSVPRWRRTLCGILVVIVCILAPVSLLAVWARNTLLNTDQYVETVGPLASEPAIQHAIANRVVVVLNSRVDIEAEVEDALPARAAFIAPFVAKGIDSFVRDATLRLAESERFQQLWDAANRRAHQQVVAVLTGEGGNDRVSTEDGKVVVRLGPIVETVRKQLQRLGIDIFDDTGGGSRAGRELVLFQSEELTKIQGAVSLLDDIAWYLPFVLLALFLIAVGISPNRRRTVLRTAVWIAVGMALVLVLFNVGRTFYLDAVTGAGADRDAAEAAYNQILSFLRTSARTAFVVAVLVAIGAWVAGPSRLATRIRGFVTGPKDGRPDSGVEPTALARFAARYRAALRVVIIGVGLIVLIAMNAVTPLTALVVALVVLALVVLVELLARGAPQVSDASEDDASGGGDIGGPGDGVTPSPPSPPGAKRAAPMKSATSRRSS